MAEHLKGKKLAQIVFLESIFLFGLQPHFLSFYSDPATFFLMALLCYLVVINLDKDGFLDGLLLDFFLALLTKLECPFLFILSP
ncbi:hypothetical protein AAFF39_08860 [Lactococcus garvieae]